MSAVAAATATLRALALRALAPADHDRIEAITRAAAVFREDEIPVALEVFDAAVAAGGSTEAAPDDHTSTAPPVRDGLRAVPLPAPYTALGAEADGRLAAWICWGPTPCTLGTYDLYWLAVDPAHQGVGIGTLLVRAMESRLAGLARMIVVETAGRADYGPTRAFYEARGYRAVARIPAFYAPDDDQVVYVKSLAIPVER